MEVGNTPTFNDSGGNLLYIIHDITFDLIHTVTIVMLLEFPTTLIQDPLLLMVQIGQGIHIRKTQNQRINNMHANTFNETQKHDTHKQSQVFHSNWGLSWVVIKKMDVLAQSTLTTDYHSKSSNISIIR